MAVPVEAAGFHVDHHGEVAAEAFGHLAEGERGGGCLRHRVSLADALSPCRRMHGRSALGRDLGAAGTLPVKPVAPECAPTVAAFVTGEKPSRAEERRVGTACVSACSTRWLQTHSNKKKNRIYE